MSYWRTPYDKNGRRIGAGRGALNRDWDYTRYYTVQSSVWYISFPTDVYVDGAPEHMIEIPIWPDITR